MGIGTSLGAFYEDQFKFQSGVEDNVVTPQELQDRENYAPPTIPASDKLGGKYLGNHPAEGTPEYDQWNRDWSQITRIPGNHTPESFMLQRPADEEGSLLPWEKREDSPGYMIIRKKKDTKEGIPMSSNDLPVVQVGMKEVPQGIKDVLGLGEGPRFKMWPERMLENAQAAAGEYVSGERAGWAMDPVTGEYHTSPNIMEDSRDMAGVALMGNVPMKAKGTTPYYPERSIREKSITEDMYAHNRRTFDERYPPETPVALGAETTGGQQVSETIANIRRRIESERVPQGEFSVFTPEEHAAMAVRERNHPRNSSNPDSLSDMDFYTYGEYQPANGMTAAQEARWTRIDREYSDAMAEGHPMSSAEHPRDLDFQVVPPYQPGRGAREWMAAQSSRREFNPSMKEFINKAKESDKLSFDKSEAHYGKHYFANDKGIGSANVSYHKGSKTLHVNDIGLISDAEGMRVSPLSAYSYLYGPQTFGDKDMLQLVKYFKKEYPDANWLTGYRVSGARVHSGKGSDNAKMWIGKGPKPKERDLPRKSIEELIREEEGSPSYNDIPDNSQ